MSLLAPTLEAWFTQRLMAQLRASPRTITSYRDSLRLLLSFAQRETSKAPSKLDFSDLDAPLVGAFLNYLETERGNGARTRNARLAAIHSLFRFAALRHPEHAALIERVLAIPPKRLERRIVSFLTAHELESLFSVPEPSSWVGRRDHALLVLAAQTGLRLSELTGLTCADIVLSRGAHVRCEGKGRKERATPLLASTVQVLRAWMAERGGRPDDPLFPAYGKGGGRLSPDAVQWAIAKYVKQAAEHCPSLRGKHVTPHVLRHSTAMLLREAGVDATVIALWLGHSSMKSTDPYMHADLRVKERALARTSPPHVRRGRYRPPDHLVAFLEAL
jgi:site-specific recombinase XerD